MDVIYRGEELKLTIYFGKPCLFIKSPDQITLDKMQFVGGYPNEYCIFLSDLTSEELNSLTDVYGNNIDIESAIHDMTGN